MFQSKFAETWTPSNFSLSFEGADFEVCLEEEEEEEAAEFEDEFEGPGGP